MPDDREEGKPNTNCNSKRERVEYGSREDDEHQPELRVTTNFDEKQNVMWCFFDERPGNDGNH